MKKTNKDEVKNAFVAKSMTVGQLADSVGCPASEIILYLLRKGVICNKNQVLPEKLVVELAHHYGLELVERLEKEEGIEKPISAPRKKSKQEKRAPIVVVVGHVDHGKTTLLDYIRKTRVAQREKGGITQHLGAYKVDTQHGEIIFLDTPGHEAFMMMRMRGVKMADIAILIVAADDGVMPQTVEAIKYAKEAKVPIIVAINKIDKVEPSRIEEVKAQLAKHDILVEDWGGDVVSAPISAKEGKGVDHLLEMINLQSELLELRASLSGFGIGYILEAKIETGRGPVGTVILRHGMAKIGDYFVAGAVVGRINSIVDSAGAKVKELSPANPALIAGFDELPQAGDIFRIVSQEEYKKLRAEKPKKFEMPFFCDVVSDESLNLIIKADTDSSKNALIAAIKKVGAQECKKISIIYAGIGAIVESDVMLASTAQARIYGFGVKPEAHVQALAKRLDVSIACFFVIYHILDDLKELIKKTRKPKIVAKKSGEAEVLKVFHIKGSIIAGCLVKSGKIIRGGKIVVYRDSRKIGEGIIQTLQREKRSMKEVAKGFECGIMAPGLADYQEGDRIECFIEEEIAP